jgi:hypothetical protein
VVFEEINFSAIGINGFAYMELLQLKATIDNFFFSRLWEKRNAEGGRTQVIRVFKYFSGVEWSTTKFNKHTNIFY